MPTMAYLDKHLKSRIHWHCIRKVVALLNAVVMLSVCVRKDGVVPHSAQWPLLSPNLENERCARSWIELLELEKANVVTAVAKLPVLWHSHRKANQAFPPLRIKLACCRRHRVTKESGVVLCCRIKLEIYMAASLCVL